MKSFSCERSADAYMESVAKLAQIVTGTDVKKVLADGYDVVTIYDRRTCRRRREDVAYLSRRSFAGSAITSISAIRPPVTTKPTTAIGFSCGTTITPAFPFTIAGRA